MKTLLITGAAGDVGTHLRRELAGKYRIRASDLRGLRQRYPGQQFARADIAKMSDAPRITKGVDAIVHLGGYSVEGPWPGILQANIIGCYNVFEAARRNGVRRILFPTSNHAVGFCPRSQTIDHRVTPRPDSRYGVSKVFGEALGSLYADKYGMEVFCMRIGNVNERPIDKRRLVRQLERVPARLPAAGRRRAVGRGSAREGAPGGRSGRREMPGRRVLRRRGGAQSGASAREGRQAGEEAASLSACLFTLARCRRRFARCRSAAWPLHDG